MASLGPITLLLSSLLMLLLISPTRSLTCTSQTFTNNHLYTNCTDLPTLTAYLHWTYNSTASSLSVAFIAPPAKSDGWIAWAINPTGTGMAGSQALIAYKQSNGSMTVDTYNVSSYSSIVKSKIAFDVSAASAEYSSGVMRIFATLALPANMVSVNQVWQVGGSVTNGVPDKHAFQTANLNSKGTLDLLASGASPAPSPAPEIAPSPETSPAPPSASTPSPDSASTPDANTGTTPGGGTNGSQDAGVSRIRNGDFCFLILLFLASIVFSF